MHVNDYKLAALVNLLTPGQIDDLEFDLVIGSINGPTEEQINDLWYKYLQQTWGLTGHINDMYGEFLLLNGYTGHVNDMWKEFWEDMIDFEPPPVFPYEFEMTDTSIQTYVFDSFGDYELQLRNFP